MFAKSAIPDSNLSRSRAMPKKVRGDSAAPLSTHSLVPSLAGLPLAREDPEAVRDRVNRVAGLVFNLVARLADVLGDPDKIAD